MFSGPTNPYDELVSEYGLCACPHRLGHGARFFGQIHPGPSAISFAAFR
jgi:hypothetical protein